VTLRAQLYAKTLIKLVVSGGLLALLAYKLDTPTVREGLLGVNRGVFLTALFSLVLLIALQGWRWLVVARALGVPVKLPTAVALAFVGSFFSQVLPSAVGGDAVRVYRLYKSGVSLGQAFDSTLIDRVLAVIGLVVLAFAGALVFGWTRMPGQLTALLAVFAAAAVVGVAVLLNLDRAPLPRWMARHAMLHKLTRVSADARLICGAPWALLAAIGASLVGHIGVSGTFWLLGRHTGLGVDFAGCVAIVPLATLLTMLPISVAGWGVREGALVLAVTAVGGNPAAALVTSILLGVATACASLPGALVWLGDSRRRSRERSSNLETS
jgi:glycosyltransferase 2 family protein